VALKQCRVSLQGLDGTIHQVDVTAESLYEAVARGLKLMQTDNWAGPTAYEATYVTVRVQEPQVEHKVSLKRFQDWLEQSRGSPRETIQRQKLKGILEADGC
jgi:hypothetical protein